MKDTHRLRYNVYVIKKIKNAFCKSTIRRGLQLRFVNTKKVLGMFVLNQ